MNHIVWITFDSARYDAFVAAKTPVIDNLGRTARRWAYASWTAPSHYAFLMGLPPHENSPGVFASVQYLDMLQRWTQRLGLGPSELTAFQRFVPALSLPAFLKGLGYRCEAYVSLPVLNERTLISAHFDHFELMPSHNDLAKIIERLQFDDGLRFFFINTGETHYPYLLPNETGKDLPRLPGVHGVWRDLDSFLRDPSCAPWNDGAQRFSWSTLKPLWEKQVACIEHLDKVMEGVLRKAPPNTWFIVTSDHGELFGESGFFGHGPITHEKVFEVFFLEGML